VNIVALGSGLANGAYHATILFEAVNAKPSALSLDVFFTVGTVNSTVNIGAVVDIGGLRDHIASGGWATIYGTNLSTTTRAWQGADFVNGALPQSLDGVTVNLNGRNAYVGYISPTQINFLVPGDPTTGLVPLQVSNRNGTSNQFNVLKLPTAPANFTFVQGGGKYAISTYADGTYNGPAGLLGNPNLTRPAKEGDVLVLWMTGLGQTQPAYPEGFLVQGSAPLINTATVTLGGVKTAIDFSGIVGAGLYQVNFHVPKLPSGDQPLNVIVNGAPTQTGIYLNVQ
jgi:uncharacterized protein (TIGR03437 family)